MMRCSRMSGRLAAIFMSGCLMAPGMATISPAAAQSGGNCNALRQKAGTPQITMHSSAVPLKFDYSLPYRQLSSLAGRSGTSANSKFGPVLGLAQVNFGEEAEFGLLMQSLPNGGWCAIVQSVVFRLSFTERRVMIAREIPKNTCIGKEVLAHEMSHIRADEQWLDLMMPRLKSAMSRALAAQRPTRHSSRDAAVNAARKSIEQARRKTMASLLADRDRRQSAIDTPAEYRRVTRSCGGEVEQYVPELRRR